MTEDAGLVAPAPGGAAQHEAGQRGGPGAHDDERLVRTVASVSRGTTVMIVSTVVLIVMQFLARVLAIRAVSQAQWGEFSLGIALTGILALVAAIGLPTAVARSIAYESTAEGRWRLIRKVTWASIGSGVTGSVLIYLGASFFAAAFHDAALTPIFQLFSVTVAFGVFSVILAAYYQGVERTGPNALFNNIVNPVLFLVFIGATIFLRAGFTGILLAYVASQGLAFGAFLFYALATLRPAIDRALPPKEPPDPSGHVSLWELSWTLFGVRAMVFVTAYGDTLILGLFRPVQDVGLYSAAMTVARLFLVGNTAVTYIFLPVSARLRRDRDYATLRQIYVTSTRWVLLLAVPMFVVLFFVPGPALSFTFGAGYATGRLALQILVFASFLSVVFGPANAALAGMGQSRSSLNATIISAIVNVALSFTLIPVWGLIGAAIAWSVARLVYPGLCLVRLWTLYRVNPFTRTVVPPLVAATVVVGPLFYFVFHHPPLLWLPALFLLALVVYWIAILVLRAVEPMDLVALRAAQRKIGFRFLRIDRFLERFVAPPASVVPPV